MGGSCEACGSACSQRCSRCTAFFCSLACQQAAWPSHRGPCGVDSRLQSSRATPFALARVAGCLHGGPALAGVPEAALAVAQLLPAIESLRGKPLEQLELVVFGECRPAQLPDLGFPIHYSGHLHDDLSLRLLYATADVFVIPSRQENLPNTGLEAHSCGTPVVDFATGGLVDIIDHHITTSPHHRSAGALAQPFDPLSLAAAIRWVLEDP
jgi:hypothetical protein